jgi:predicted amidohydrolase YtcJ
MIERAIQAGAALAFALAVSCGALAQTADLVLRNGRIHTVDGNFRTVEAVAVRAGRFTVVGSEAEAMREAGPSTTIVDLGGRTAVPGLIDNHLHQLFMATSAPNVKLIEARSIADVQRAIRERAAGTPPGQWVVAFSGWHESLLAEGRMPTRHEIDAAASEHPVLIPRGGHVVTVNTKALEAAGITRETPNPPGGVIVRDPATGEATGVLLQNAANCPSAVSVNVAPATSWNAARRTIRPSPRPP